MESQCHRKKSHALNRQFEYKFNYPPPPKKKKFLDFKFIEQNLLWGGKSLLQLFLQIKALKSYSYTYRLHLPSTGACAEESFGGVDRLVSGIHCPVEEKWLLLLCLLLHECCRFLQKDRFH